MRNLTELDKMVTTAIGIMVAGKIIVMTPSIRVALVNNRDLRYHKKEIKEALQGEWIEFIGD